MKKLLQQASLTLLLLLGSLPAICVPAAAQTEPDWINNHQPFRILGNLYYVGSEGLAAYLIATDDGLILINSNLATSPPQLSANVEALGFHFADVKILLISHAHFDHDAGSAEVKRLTHARYLVMEEDVPVVEDGGRSDFAYGARPELRYAPAKVDRVLHDGDQVRLGGAVLTAHKTAGHTKGCTTWTLPVEEGGRSYDVVIVGSPNVNPGYKLRGDPNYPNMAADYAAGFRVLEQLHCDVFLGAHGSYFGLEEKFKRISAGGGPGANPFIDPAGYARYVADRKAAFEKALAAAR